MIKATILILVFLTGIIAPVEAKPPYQVIGYMDISYAFNSRGFVSSNLQADFPWSTLTRVYAFSAGINSGGSSPSITYSPLPAYNNLVSIAHSNSTRVYLTVGGASSDSAFSAATSSASKISAFVSSIMSSVGIYGFDGVDIDWEYPNHNNANTAETTQFIQFMQALSTALRAQSAYDGAPDGVDVYGDPGYDICGFDWPVLGQYVDDVILSGYSMGAQIGSPVTIFDGPLNVPAGTPINYNCYGLPYTLSIVGVSSELSSTPYNFPVSQMILGSPLYLPNSSNTDIYTALQSGVNTGYSATEAESVYNYGGSYYSGDGPQSYCDKISWALSKGMPGIALFELSDACPYTDPPVTALWAAISNSSGCVALPTATFTATATSTPTVTSTNTPCMVGGVPCTSTNTPTVTFTPTFSPTVTVNHLTTYPNPTNGQPISVQVPISSVTNVKLQVFTLAFRKVWEQDYPQVAPNTPLSVSLSDKTGATLANGLYFIVAVTNQGTFKTKLLILR